ncbi:hypothetical protein NDU88_001168 [Pleurodeles waltl]|uniref:Uncharacterized protein n=1 Tax=Pleurodeles waltl TaxID=8319 RepID=A0AAV7RA75_PLEWA|nr:hypothetical protein NDU88_001168 [Pleurodeles waltl]
MSTAASPCPGSSALYREKTEVEKKKNTQEMGRSSSKKGRKESRSSKKGGKQQEDAREESGAEEEEECSKEERAWKYTDPGAGRGPTEVTLDNAPRLQSKSVFTVDYYASRQLLPGLVNWIKNLAERCASASWGRVSEGLSWWKETSHARALGGNKCICRAALPVAAACASDGHFGWGPRAVRAAGPQSARKLQQEPRGSSPCARAGARGLEEEQVQPSREDNGQRARAETNASGTVCAPSQLPALSRAHCPGHYV